MFCFGVSRLSGKFEVSSGFRRGDVGVRFYRVFVFERLLVLARYFFSRRPKMVRLRRTETDRGDTYVRVRTSLQI